MTPWPVQIAKQVDSYIKTESDKEKWRHVCAEMFGVPILRPEEASDLVQQQDSDDPLDEDLILTLPSASCKSGHMRLRSRQECGTKSKSAYVHHPYGPEGAAASSSRLSFDNATLYNKLLTGCNPGDWGMWTKGKIPINEVFTY